MGKWRPEGWKNPHGSTIEECKATGDLRPGGFISSTTQQERDAHEAGADAMLKALKEKGAWMTPEQMRLLAPDRKYPYGWIVFIPDDKENEAATTNIDLEKRCKILRVGKFTEHADGTWEIFGWTFDGNMPTEYPDIEAMRQDCKKRAKEAGTYIYDGPTITDILLFIKEYIDGGGDVLPRYASRKDYIAAEWQPLVQLLDKLKPKLAGAMNGPN